MRMNEDDFNFMKFLCDQYQCDQTQLITELIRRGEYTILNYETIKEFNKVFGNIGNNINQIARILNTANKNILFTEEQFQEILRIHEYLKIEYSKHQLGSNKMLKKIYRIKLEKGKNRFDDFYEAEDGNFTMQFCMKKKQCYNINRR